MKTLKNKRILISLLTLALIISAACIFLNQKPVEVFSDISFDSTIDSSSNDNSNNSSNKVVSSGSYTYYKNYEEMDSRANLVFIGTVVKVNDPEEIQIGDITTDIYTVSEFRVDKVIKGNVKKGDIVKVKQIGGSYNGTQRVDQEVEFFKKGEERLLFLASYDEFKYKVPASPLNPYQGSMLIVDGKTKKSNNFQIINDDVSEDSVVDAIKEKIKNIKDKEAEAAASTNTQK